MAAVTPAGAIALLAAGRALLDPADPSARPAALPGLSDDLLRLAYDHADLEAATDALTASPSGYRAALGVGLHDLLGRFQARLLDVEAQLAEDPGLTVTHVQYALRDAASSLAAVSRAVAHVQAHNLRGGALLNHLFQASLSGDAATADAFRRLLHAVQQPWFAQLTHWLAYGEVDDSARGDFLVVPRTLGGGSHDAPPPPPSSSTSLAGAVAVLPCAGAPQSGRAAAAALRPLLAEHEWSDGYVIDASLVPDAYVSAASAGDILAIGKAVRLLRHHADGYDGDDVSGSSGSAGAGEEGAAAVAPGGGSRAAASASPLAASRGSRVRDSREDGAAVAPGGGGGEAPASTGGPTRITREDSLATSRLLATLRNAPAFSSLAFDVVISRVRSVVYARLWRLLLDEGGGGAADGGLLTHTRALQDYLLMGRGDLFQAFLELGGPAMAATPAHAPQALQQLTRGAWTAAVQAATPTDVAPTHAGGGSGGGDHDSSHGQLHQSNSSAASVGGGSTAYRPLGASGLWGSGGSATGDGGAAAATGGGRTNAVGDPCLNRCSLTLLHRGVKWEGEAGAGALARGWHPTAPGGYATADAVARVPKVGVALVTRGAAAATAAATSGGAGRRHGLPLTPLADPSPQPSAGAAWLSQPVNVSAGCLLRVGARLSWGSHASLAASDAACTATKFAETASFALVLQRTGPLTLGYPAAAAAAADSSAGAPATGSGVPTAGFAGVPSSLVVHVIAKRLPATGAASPPPQHGRLRDGVYVGPVRCRIVVAVYGPPGRRKAPSAGGDAAGTESPDGRPLLASGAVLEQWLPVADDDHGDDGGLRRQQQPRRLHHPLQLAVEYLPPSAVPQDDDGTAPLTSRLRVAVLDASGNNSSDDGAPTRHVIDAQLLPLEVQLATAAGSAAPGHPGRGRLWVGCTAEAAAAAAPAAGATATGGSSVPPAVSLAALDAVGYSEDDDGWGSLALAYAVPWPLHVVLHSGSLALYADVFRFLRRARSLSLGLQDVWRSLQSAYSATPDAADGIIGATAASAAATTRGGVSAQLSGAGGKRAADPAVHARRQAREAAFGGPRLRPVWLLRARMALVVDALLYHLHVDVVSAAQARWEEAAAGSADYASLAAAHGALLASLASGSFLAHGSVLAVVLRLLAHVERFVRLVGARAGAGDLLALADAPPGGDRDVVAELAAAFDTDARLLQAALTAAGGQLDAGSLLTRLAFNEAPGA
jgi:hypothetical protein